MMNEQMFLPRMKHRLNTDVKNVGGVGSVWRVLVRSSNSAVYPCFIRVSSVAPELMRWPT
jgi:hypothetical protein